MHKPVQMCTSQHNKLLGTTAETCHIAIVFITTPIGNITHFLHDYMVMLVDTRVMYK